MADGNSQYEFNLPRQALVSALRPGEIVVDLFAGGGGASEALEQALDRPVDIAINHDEWAIGMHAANHPFTQHLRDDVWHADPVRLVAGRLVGWFHASPDCTHFSQAKGGQPRSKATRSLSWVVLKWVGSLARVGLAPRIISLENVEQILKWGPLVAKRDKATGRVIKLDGSVAAKGERVSVWEQSLVPDKRHQGRTWDQFVAALRGLGYTVEWRKLIASDYGAGTSRKRLFMVARRDVKVIPWPAPTHGKAEGLLPLVTAADCIDFTVPCPSIFERKKPLADATMRRIARGVQRYVLAAAEPFIVGVGGRMGQTAERSVHDTAPTCTSKYDAALVVPTLAPFVAPVTHHGERRVHPADEPIPTITGANRGELTSIQPVLAPFVTEHANASSQRSHSAAEPMRTQCAQVKGGHFSAVAPVLVQAAHGEGKPGGVQRWGSGVRDASSPMGVITASGSDHAIAAATLVQTGYGERSGQAPRSLDLQAPLGVTPAGGIKHAAIAAFLEQANTGMVGHDAREPVSTIVGRASTQRLVTANMAKLRGTSSAADAADPLATISAGGEHHALVASHLATLRNGSFGRAADEPVGTICGGSEHHAVVECHLEPEHEAGALRVAAFLIKYYGTAFGIDIDEPMDTVTTKDRLALVTVWIHGHPYVIVDIGLRMLRREELFRAQGFPASYIIDRTADGRPLSISRSVRMVGNSVSPPPLLAIARANLDQAPVVERIAA